MTKRIDGAKRGRNTKRTKAREAAILEELESGQPYRVAARKAGVHEDTVANWRAEDPEFSDACEKAIASADGEVIETLRGKAIREKDTGALIWLCKTRIPEMREPKDQPLRVDASKVTGLQDVQVLILEIIREGIRSGVPPAAIGELTKAISSLAESDKLTGLQQQIEELRELVARKTA